MNGYEERGVQNVFLPFRYWLMMRDLTIRNSLASLKAFTAVTHQAHRSVLTGQFDVQKIGRRSLGLEQISEPNPEKGPMDYDSL